MQRTKYFIKILAARYVQLQMLKELVHDYCLLLKIQRAHPSKALEILKNQTQATIKMGPRYVWGDKMIPVLCILWAEQYWIISKI